MRRIRDNVLLLVCVVLGDDCDGRFCLAQIHRLMWNIRRNEDEVSRLVHHALLEALTVARLDSTLDEIDC